MFEYRIDFGPGYRIYFGKDGETLVLGGIYSDTVVEDETGVPLLRKIPILGWLFKTKGTGRDKTNLFIFITPHIIRNQAEATAIYQKKRDEVGNIEEGIIKMNEKRTFQKPQTDPKN